MKKSSNVLSKIVVIIFNFHFLPFSVLFLHRLQAQLSSYGKIQEKWRSFIGYVATGVSVSWSLLRNFLFFSFAVYENPLVPNGLKMFCLNCFVFSCIYSFFIKWWNSMPFFCMNKQTSAKPFFSQIDQMCRKKYNRNIFDTEMYFYGFFQIGFWPEFHWFFTSTGVWGSLMISRLIELSLVVLKLLMFRICGVIGISEIEFFTFSEIESVKIKKI